MIQPQPNRLARRAGPRSLRTLAFLVPALVIVRYGVTTREKAYLEREFGDDYRHFRTAVRRWL